MKRLNCSCLWPGIGEEVLENASILIGDNGAIVSVEAVHGSISDSYFMMPAFVDAHCHFLWMGLENVFLDLSVASTGMEMLDIVSHAARSGTDILQGEKYDESAWIEPVLPSLEQLDSVTGNRPVFLRRICGHQALANSAMLAMLPADAPDVDRNTGIIMEDVAIYFNKSFPLPAEVLDRAALDASSRALSEGVTALGTMEPFLNLEVLDRTGVGVRLSCNVFIQDLEKYLMAEFHSRKEELIFPGVKLFLDGALGARNAAVDDCFLTCPSGKLIYSDDELYENLVRIGELGMTPVVHAIGARALRQLDRASLKAFTRIGRRRTEFRIRIEHAEELLPAWPGNWIPDVHQFSMQPNFVNRWQMPNGMYHDRLPPERAVSLNPFGPVVRNGFQLGFGSDGMPFGPLFGLEGATGHPVEELGLTCGAALHAYTLGAANICGFRSLAVPLAPGRPADIVVLSGNPFSGISWEDIDIVATLRDGNIVYGNTDLIRKSG